ncbi:hypothetical protein ABTL18_19305, partial [Acinetobacter baumannii]
VKYCFMDQERLNNKGAALNELSKVKTKEAKKAVENDGYGLEGGVSVEAPKGAVKVDMGWKENWNLIVGLCILAVVLTLEYGFKIEIPKITAFI